MTEPRKPRARKATAKPPVEVTSEDPADETLVLDEPAVAEVIVEAEPVEGMETLTAMPPTPSVEPVPEPVLMVSPVSVVDPAVDTAAAVAEVAEVRRAPRSEIALQFRRTISQGDHGPAVDRVLEALAAKGFYEGPIDGRYGTRVARAVRQFQQANGLRVTGDVNVQTWEAILS